MILGIDVGGTHTDAVAFEGGEIHSTVKVLTGHDLISSVTKAIQSLKVDCSTVRRVVLSTTLSTNAIIEKTYPRTGMIVAAGPGIDPHHYFINEDFFLVDGAIDHRGREYVALDIHQVESAARNLKAEGIEGLGIVSKFSIRNPDHERQALSLLADDFDHISMGHRMSGSRNFPRRIYTTFFNTAVMPLQQNFVAAVQDSLSNLGIGGPLLFLKADGGTYTYETALRLPIETVLSGPAASIMGAVALAEKNSKVLVLDIGGTTTDIGILIDGVPVLEKGAKVGGYRTLVRGLNARSVGAGGDSLVHIADDALCVGPQRKGQPACLGGKEPTTMDALCLLGRFPEGNIKLARKALTPIARKLNLYPESLAGRVVEVMTANISEAVRDYIDELNAHPVYTIEEMLHPDMIRPDMAMVVGGPAALLQDELKQALDMPVVVPEHSGVANALGAALARTTAQISLMADTQLGRMTCPELDFEGVAEPDMDLDDLRDLGFRMMREHSLSMGLADEPHMDVVEEQSFNMVRGFATAGRNMRLKIQTRPGIIDEWRSL